MSAALAEAAPRGAPILAGFADLRREHASIAESLAGIRADLDEMRADMREDSATLDRIASALLGRNDQ